MRQGWISLLWTFVSPLCLFSITRAEVLAADQTPKARSEAADETASEAEIDDLENDADEMNESIFDSDRSATERITNAASLQLGGGVRKGAGLDLRVGWHLDENRLLEARFAQFEGDDISSFNELAVTMLLIQGKFFMGNSLFMGIATGWSQLSVKDEETFASGTEALLFNYEGEVDQFLLALSMGNQWQFGSWTLGIDWLNLYMPFTASKVDSTGDFSMAGGELRRLNNEQNLKAEAWEVDYGVSLYLGYVW